ncbi:hypothetical protein [Arthrobacter rhombi]|uniref:hypothetical protein n=1 Tax=Arthrobacter rhombi TaxID=71253 RepID=UPI003F8E1FED
MRPSAFQIYTIAGTLTVLFGTLAVGQLVSDSPLPALLAGLGLLLLIAAPFWWRFRHAFSGPDPLRGGPPEQTWTEDTPSQVLTRNFARAGILLGAGLVISVVVFALTTANDPPDQALKVLSYIAQGLFLVAAITVAITTVPLDTASHDAVGDSRARMKRINQVALGGKHLSLSEHDQLVALRVAIVAPVRLRLQGFGLTFFLALLAVGICRDIPLGDLSFGDAFIPALLLLALIRIPYVAGQLRRARHYASENLPRPLAERSGANVEDR